jgi:hypothetical protein
LFCELQDEELGRQGEQQDLQNDTPAADESPPIILENGGQQHEHPVSQNEISAEELVELDDIGTSTYETPPVTLTVGEHQLQRYSFLEVSRMTDGFAQTQQIGEGGSCKVYLGKLGGREVAVKRAYKRDEPGPSHHSTEQFRAEVPCHKPIDYNNPSCFTIVIIFGAISLPFSYVVLPSYLEIFFKFNASSIRNLQKN